MTYAVGHLFAGAGGGALGFKRAGFEGAEHRVFDRGLREPGEPNPTIACACGCGATFSRFDDDGRPRRFVSGHNAGAHV